MAADLVDLAEFIPGIRVELRYATPHNFTGRILYSCERAWLREPVAVRLAAAHADAAALGLGLKVWDAFRPLSAQRLLWAACPDPRYVAPPERGSRHNRGAAVDVTLVRLDDGSELPMGTDFDDFTPQAAPDFPDLPDEVLTNRRRLRDWMEAHGFRGISQEWWHFDAVDWEQYPILEDPAGRRS